MKNKKPLILVTVFFLSWATALIIGIMEFAGNCCK